MMLLELIINSYNNLFKYFTLKNQKLTQNFNFFFQ